MLRKKFALTGLYLGIVGATALSPVFAILEPEVLGEKLGKHCVLVQGSTHPSPEQVRQALPSPSLDDNASHDFPRKPWGDACSRCTSIWQKFLTTLHEDPAYKEASEERRELRLREKLQSPGPLTQDVLSDIRTWNQKYPPTAEPHGIRLLFDFKANAARIQELTADWEAFLKSAQKSATSSRDPELTLREKLTTLAGVKDRSIREEVIKWNRSHPSTPRMIIDLGHDVDPEANIARIHALQEDLTGRTQTFRLIERHRPQLTFVEDNSAKVAENAQKYVDFLWGIEQGNAEGNELRTLIRRETERTIQDKLDVLNREVLQEREEASPAVVSRRPLSATSRHGGGAATTASAATRGKPRK